MPVATIPRSISGRSLAASSRTNASVGAERGAPRARRMATDSRIFGRVVHVWRSPKDGGIMHARASKRQASEGPRRARMGNGGASSAPQGLGPIGGPSEKLELCEMLLYPFSSRPPIQALGRGPFAQGFLPEPAARASVRGALNTAFILQSSIITHQSTDE